MSIISNIIKSFHKITKNKRILADSLVILRVKKSLVREIIVTPFHYYFFQEKTK
eukprot:UN02200